MPEPIRVAVIGASGMMGQTRLENFTADPRSCVVAACGRDRAKLAETVTDPQVRLVTEADEVYAAADVDAVAVCLFNRRHVDHVRRALAAGKHVLCEYPLANSLADYDELTALAQERGVVLHHSLTVRAESLHLTLKDALFGLGDPRCAVYRYYGAGGWYVEPALRGEIFCALHIHFMEQFVDLFGKPEGLVAHGIEADGKVSAIVMMQWPGGLVGTVEFCMGFSDRPAYTGTIVTTDGWCGFAPDPAMRVTVAQDGQVRHVEVPPDTSKLEDAESFLDEVLGTGGPQCDLAVGREAIARCLECSRQVPTPGIGDLLP